MKLRRNGILTSLALTLILSSFSPLTKTTLAATTINPPSIAGKYAVTFDYDTGEIIYAKDIDEKAYPASTTKLLTSLLFAETKSKEDIITYTEEAKKQPDASLNVNFKPINVGDTLTGDAAMKAVLLYSANDIAMTMANAVSGSSEEFANALNDKASSLGLKNTHFTSPTGLHDKDHYTTAYDISVIGKAAFENPWIRETMGLKNSDVTLSNGTKILIENRNKTLGEDGNVGGKTGYTSQAGKCLVAVYERDGRKIVGAVLNSIDGPNGDIYFNDMKKIMDYSFQAQKTPYLKSGDVVDTVSCEYKLFGFIGPKKSIDVPLSLTEDITYYDNEVNKKELTTKVDLNDMSAWKLARNSKDANLKVSLRSYSKDYNLKADISTFSIIKANLLIYIVSLVVLALIIFAIFSIIRFINTKNRRRRRKSIF